MPVADLAAGDFLAIAACMTAISGLLTAWNAMRSSKRAAEGDCIERLRETRVEAEKVAYELHKVRMSDAQRQDYANAEKAGWSQEELDAYQERWSHLE